MGKVTWGFRAVRGRGGDRAGRGASLPWTQGWRGPSAEPLGEFVLGAERVRAGALGAPGAGQGQTQPWDPHPAGGWPQAGAQERTQWGLGAGPSGHRP